jgi:hypothetical protein
VEPVREQLVMYGQPSEVPNLEWAWVDERLGAAPAYWVIAQGSGQPHPRPVWGVWLDEVLYLSIGSPRINAALARPTPVTIHLGSETDVVILEGTTAASSEAEGAVRSYNAKYDWDYRIAEYGAFTTVVPAKVMAWRSAGWAGREGFTATGRWRFASHTV